MSIRVLLACLLLTACSPDPLVPSDAGLDAPLPPRTREELPAPGALEVGLAEAAIPAPLGIGTMGYGALGAAPNPTPFANVAPGTTRSHGQLTVRAVAISRGPAHEIVFVRLDTIGVFQQLRSAVLDALEARIGRRLDDALILASNHTHSGPGRLLMIEGALTRLGDTFFPELYDRIVAAVAGVIADALDDLAPAELAHTIARTSAAHSDRRCENDPLPQLQESGDLPVIAIRRAGRLDAIVASYAYHGTVLGLEDHTLSGDMGSVVEQRIEERFDHPVMVLFFDSWGADMAPGSPAIDPGAVGADQPDGYERMQELGDVVADAIIPRLDALAYSADAAVRARTYQVPLDTAAIGYDTGVFPYPNGAAFCGLGGEGNCMSIMPDPNLTRVCLRISASDGLPHQTVLSAGQLGDLRFVTAPGEWSTALSNGVLEEVRASSGSADAMLIGYANDYTGYSLGEDDWWQGGYEASGALWGPRQGAYLAARLVESFETFEERWNEPPWLEPAPVPRFSGYTYEPYVPEGGIEAGTIATDVPPTAAQADVVTFTIRGNDPWLGLPVATLHAADGTPVLRRNGEPIDTTGYDSWVDLEVEPAYTALARASERTFLYTFHFPVASRAGSAAALSGAYRFEVSIPAAPSARTLMTGIFTVSP